MAYPNPYPRPAPDTFIRRWLFITACIAALMLLWQFLPAIEAWFSPREAAERTVTARGDLAADEKATIELFENHAPRWSTSPPRSWCATSGRAMSSPCPVARDRASFGTTPAMSSPTSTSSRARPKPPSSLPTAATTRPRWWGEPSARHRRTQDRCRLQTPASPCRSAPAPTSRWDRRCLLSATPLAWTGRSPPASSPRSTARYREKRAARPLITWFRPTPPLTPATRAAPARFGRAAYRHQHGDLQPLRRLGRDRFCRAGGHRHAGSAATHQDRQIHPPGAWHRGGRTAQSAPACADGKQGRVRAACHPGSAAHKAGLAGVEVTPQGIVPGDRIIDVDGKATDDVAAARAARRQEGRRCGGLVSGTGRQIARGACGAATRN